VGYSIDSSKMIGNFFPQSLEVLARCFSNLTSSFLQLVGRLSSLVIDFICANGGYVFGQSGTIIDLSIHESCIGFLHFGMTLTQ
jgi:hypothetical protein